MQHRTVNGVTSERHSKPDVWPLRNSRGQTFAEAANDREREEAA